MCGERAFNLEPLGAWQPPTDIFETEEAILVFAEIPGMDENDIDVEFSDGRLVITGEKKLMSGDVGRCCYCIERGFGAFRRTFTLYAEIDKDAIAATYKKGVLKITLPKR